MEGGVQNLNKILNRQNTKEDHRTYLHSRNLLQNYKGDEIRSPFQNILQQLQIQIFV